MTVRGGGVPCHAMAFVPPLRMGPPPRSLAADAHACIMVRVTAIHRIQGCGASPSCPDSEAPLGRVIPTTTSVPTCSSLSRLGLETIEPRASAERRPALTAPARVDFQHVWVGAKKRESKSNKETGMKK